MAQVNDNDDIKWLYGKLKAKGYNIGSEAEFKSSLANGEDRKWYYEKAKGMGLDMGSMADFESMYAPKAAPAPKRETPSSGQRKPASAVSVSPEQPKQKPKGTPMTEQDKIRMSLQMGQMKQQVQQGIANTNAKIGRMMEPLTQKGRERRRLGEFQARMAGTPTHVVGFNTASPAPAGSGARGGSQQKPVQSEQSPQPYGVKYENGKAKTQWVLPDGTLTTSLIEANQAEYEARTARLAHQFQNRMKENGLDPNKPEDVRKQAQLDYEAPMRKAIEDEWQRAEAEDRAADEAYRKDMERAEGGGFWDRLKKSITPLGPDGMPLRRGDETLRDIKRAAKRQDTFNLEKMAQSVLQNMPQDYKDNQMLNYSRYFREHPSELKGRTVSQAAKEALQGEVYHATYERAVQARMPKSKTEFLLRKVADQPFFSQTMSDNMAARLFSHSIGTEAADMDAMGRYGTDHRALDITGTVLNMAIDPTTYISGGVGSFAGKQALKLSGKVALKGASKEAAERYVGRTLAGRMVAGVAAGSANFGTFEGLKNMQQQMRLGGTLNPETGEYEFSAGDMLKATGHGMLLGSVTGTLSPVLGNVSDKLVKATESTAGKVGIRAGELMTSTVAEGTIFATPEWIENAQLADEDPRKRKAMDIWTDNMAMMLGFKVSHGIKSAPQVIAGLRPIAEPKTMEERNHNRRSFAERLRKRMDASPRDLDFTKEEREELRRNGYGDLASLFTRTPKQPNKPKAKPTMTDGKTMTFDVDYQHAEAKRVSNPEFDGYEAMERLMQDPNVSQSARAKAYYILTGRMLPMGTVTGYTTNKDANGVTVQAMTAQGEVVTSRHFKTEEEAKKEEANIMRQAELNSVDVGERYKEAAANAKVVQAAVESVAPGADFATVMRNYKAVKEGDKDAIAAYGKMVEDIDRAIEANKTMADDERPEAIRASIKEETGVDVDATLRKEPKNRTEEEQAAVEDYIKRLFPEQKSEEAGASTEAEQPMSEAESAAAAAYDQARLLWDKVEKGDTDAKAEVDAITLRMQEAYQMCEDAFGADAEMRIAEINEDPWPLVNNPELSEDQQDAVLYYVNAKAAMEGVMDASNEAADGKRKEVEANVERHTHKDMGVVQPATMKVDDKPVYVVKGNVVMLPDGSGIDVRNSDQSIVICDAETGEYKFASPDQLFSLGEAIDPQTELDEAYANIQAEHEAVLGVPENGENVQGNGENVPNSAENVSQLTDEQLQQYAHSAFNEATQSNGITIPQEQAEQLQQHNQQMLEQEQQRKEEEANRQPTALERVPINEETGEPMFEKADRETALDALNEITGGNDENTTAIVRAQVEQATKALEALKKKEPTKKAPSLKGSPMAMVKAQQEAEANYNTAMEEYNAQVAAAEENLNAWSRINSLMNDRKRAIREQQEAERKVREEKLHTESYGTYNAKRTDVEIPANKLFKSESELFTAKNGNSIAVNDTQAKARYELVAHKDAQGHLKSVSVIKYHDFDYNDEEPLVKSVKKDVVEINAPEEAGYSITPSTYTNKKGKTSDVSLLTFDHDLTADQERAVKEFAKERTGEGRFAPARGWKDRESGGWMFRSEEDARKAAEMVGNEEAVADNQPMTAQELRDAVEPKKPTTSKKTASKKPANRVESVPAEEPIEPEKPKYEVSDEEMNGLMNDIRDILGIGDDEGDAGFKFREPDELTAEQRQKLMSVGQRLAMAMVERGNESFGNYASMMVKALGDKVRPWLKAFYGGLEYVPGYDKYALTPYEEVKAFDVENFDKPTKDVMAQANMIVEEGKAQVAAEKANNELKATRNEQRKETEKQTAANTDAVAAEAKSVASEATALAETSSDEQALTGAAERVDETLDKVNEQLALLGYYEADEVEKDYNEAYGYMRNAEKKAVKDAANLASQLISDLNLSHYEASHSKQTDKKGNRKKKPLAVSNISPIGGDVSIHLPLEEGRELYLTIGVEPRAAKGVDGFGGSDLEVTHIMFRVDHPEGTGNDRYGRNVFVDSNVTYSDLLKQVQREAYKYLIGSGVTNEGEYAAGDKVQYSTDGGRTWTDAVVVQPNDEGGIRIDTGLAPVMWVNAHPDQLRHKPSESAEPKHEAVGDFYEDGINEYAVAALPEDTAIQLHVVDILNPGMTDHSMKSKIESLNTLLPKISDKKLSELDKEYGDDKDMGTHIKAEVARRENEGIFKKAERIAKEAKTERKKTPIDNNGFGIYQKAYDDFIDGIEHKGMLPNVKALKNMVTKAKRRLGVLEKGAAVGIKNDEDLKRHEKAVHELINMRDAYQAMLDYVNKRMKASEVKTSKVKPEQPVGDLFAGLFDEPNNNETADSNSSSPSQTVAGAERPDTVGIDETGTDGAERTTAVAGTDGERSTDASRENGREAADGAVHGTDEVGGIQPPVGNRGRDESTADGTVSNGATDERGRVAGPRTVQTGEIDGGGKELSSGEPASSTGEGSRPSAVKKQRTPVRKFTNNFHYGTDGNEADNYTPAQRLEGNVSAIEVIAKLFKEGRKATDEEKQILSRFRGWGQIDQLSKFYSVDQMRRDTYGNSPYRRLANAIDTLDPDGKKGVFAGIKRAALSSYYTPTKIASAMNSFLSLAGFKGGTFLDPSMGNGIFEGTLPKDIQERTMITGVELDWLSGQISRALYPDADVRICGFEKSELTPNSQDVVTSNVPFGDIEVNDPTWKNDNSPVKRSAQKRIHNYYAVKMLELTRPGGIVAMMTSPAVMDTQSNQHIRRYIAEQGEFLGAVRLPDNTFQGTGAMADIIYIRKWKDEEDAQKTRENPDYAAREQAFLSSAETTAPNKRNGEKQKVSHNAYYASNRKNMIGDVVAGNQYNDKSFGLHSELTTDQIAKEVEKAVKRIVGDRKGMLFDTTRTSREVKQAVREEYKGDGNWVSTGNLVIQDGKVGVLTATKNEYGEVTRVFEEQPQLAKQKKRIIAMGEVRTAMKELIAGQIDGLSDTKLNMLRAKLKRAYDEFVSKYGKLQDTDNAVVLSDIDGYTLQALEVWKGGKFQGLSDIFTKNTIKPALKLEDAKTPQEAITTSLAEYGEIRGEYIEKTLGADWFEQCGDLVFKEPNATDRYVTRDEYLSGDVVAKLEEAKTAAATDPTFERNVKELEQVQPATIPFDDITIHLGARWIPQEVLNDFVKDTLGLHASSSRNYEWVDGERREIIKSGVVYVPETDTFEINIEAKELGGQADDWKTADKSVKEIFQAALEDKDFRIVRKDKDGNTWIDQEATELANSKVADLREHFEQWLPGDDARVQTMERAYNDRFNRIVLRKWDGSHLNVPGLMGKELRPHQKDAVWMLINNRGGIVDHIVGAGKTLVMQSAIMEMRRMGIAKKPMIVALKSTVPQIAREFKEAYPTARVLAPSEKDFSTENRKKFFANISLNDYDCIIVSHEQYCKIPHSEEAEGDVVNEQLAQLDAMIEYLYGTGDKSQLTKRQIKSLEKRRQNLHAKLEKRLDRSTDREFCFENMGIDYLFVDECHQFKSLPYVTSYQNVAGLGEASGSNKAVALLTGIRHLQKMHQGDKGTVFLSGTTITNSLVEIYNLLNYLRPRKLEQLGMPTFDAWASTFAVHSSELEAGVSNEFKMKDRFRYFDNVPELSQLYAEIADVRNDYNLQLPKPKVDGKTVIVPQSDAVAEINREVVNMLQTKDGSYFGIHPKDPKKFPWGLVASGISAKAAVSPRLVFPEMDDSVGKISYCCDNIKKSYDEMKEQKGVQLVFCELGVPSKDKNEYDAYHDIIDRLTKDYGIPREEIAYIQQVKKDTDKEALFQKVRDGKVRILIGGTQNMGTGVNVQTRITDLHMLTVPWQPADLEQCIGRGSRQGNVVAHDFLNNKVRVHYYATEGSLDLYKYQLLDAKGKMFTQFKMGTISGERSFDEGDADENGNIDPAQMVALLSGNPIIFEKSKQDKLVKKLKSLYNGFLRDQQRKRQNYETVTKKVDNLKRLISLSDSDVHDLQREGFKPDEKGTYPSKVKVCVEGSYYGQDFDKPKEAGQYILEQLKNNKKVVLAGFGQRADVVFVTGDDLLSSHYEVQLGGNNAWSIRYTKRMPQDPTQAGLVFRSLLEQIIHNNEVYHREYDTNSEMLKTMPKGDAPFPKQKELDEAIAKQKELDAEYNKLGQSEEDKTKFRLLDEDDPKAMELESLPESELVPVYRNVQAFEDDALGSPMAFTDAETGERRTLEGRRWNYSAPPKVELTEEQQRKLDELNKNGYIMVDGKKSTELQIKDGLKFVKPKTKEAQLQYFLKKNPEDKGLWAAYDPYDHAIETPLNTQFGEAYKRPNLVVVRSLIPKSEIDEPFHADYALLPTGAHQWNNGRTLYLSRWSKIDKVLTREEEAKLIDEYWKKHPGKREELKTHRDYNRFVPQVRRELEKMGYRFELDGKELTPEESLALDKQNWESRDVIPGREGHTPFVNNEDIARINAKMAGKWVGEPKEAMESAMSERVTELSERLHTPVRIIRTEEEVAALPSVRQRRMKGSFNPITGEVTIVVPNNANMADIENTFVHEVVGHDGLRVLFPDEAKLNNALDELYRVSKDEIRGTIDRMAQKMYDAEVDRIREKKRKEHVANGEDANASYYADMAAAHAEAGKKREQFKRDATEEYGADLAGRIGEKGFEKMSAEELTFWGKLKAMLQKALQKLLDGLKIPGKRKWGDKDWAFVLHEAYKRKKNGGKPTVFDAADTEVMRRKTGFGDTKFSDGYKKSAQPNEAALKHLEPIDVEHAAKDNHSPETDPDGGIMFRDGDMGLEETITKMKVEASQANADNWQAKQDAMRAIGGNLNKLRQAMARQREYDLSTVKSITDLAKVLLENGLLDDLSKYETKRILSAVNNVHGKQDVSDYVQKVMDIMVENQLRMGANQLGKLLSIRGSRVDARGIEVQGQLDPEGQRIAQVVRKATSLPKENIEERIADCTNRMSSDDNAVAEEAAIEYSGLLLAHQFVEDITESKAEEKALRESIKEAKADLDAGTMEADAYREYVESTNDAIRQNKIERAEAYRSIVEQVGGVLGGSVERAKAWREAEKQRVETIHHNANSDMTGRPNDEHHKESKAQKIANNSIVRFVLAPLGTFDQMLRMFGKKSVNGEGYLWNRYMRGWVEATEKEYTGYQNALKTLDEKVSEVFDKKMKWGDLFSLERNLPKATVTFWDGGEQKAHELTQGNLLYIYMVDKMADGRMKLRRMGITEEDVENIKEFVDPRFLELADWMQDEFLVEKRNEYNEVHKRMFGASMAAIENYFPLKILANARIEEVDVADDTTDTALPATSTGSIIKRRRNNLALDVMGADAFSVILDHIQQMERWASFAEFNRDLNTLLSYKRFRNQVMNMTSVYGGGKTLWKNFRNVCSMAAGAYRPPIAQLDKAAVNIAKGVTAAKVSFRVFTALKQFLSMPAYLSDSSPVYLAGNIANPIGAWKWSMENLPLFEKRWKSRIAGDPRLMKSEMDWKMWQNRAVEIASRIGMSPNAFVDALTVAIGAHSMYQTKKKKYLRYGYDEETAEKRAKQDATILFNQTQQSSESAFLSTMQTDRSWLSVLFTVFRNSSMSYTRQLYDALRNLKHRFEPGYKGLTEEYLAKQMRRDGIDPDKADQNAKSEYRRSLMRDIVRVGVFGYLLQFAWNLGAYLPYLLLGDDKDEKSDMWHDIFCHTMFGSIEGLTGGDVMSAVGNGFAKGEGLNLFSASKDMPLSSDLQNIVNKWNKDKVAAMNDVTNLMVQSGIGVNPQSLTDAVVAIMDYCGDDANTSRECALLITRIINCPQSQIDKIYFDELNATAAEAQGMTPAEIAERYARYKMHRGAPLTGWAYTDEARDSVMTAQQNRVLTKAKEKLNSRMETEETKQLLSDYDAVAKQETALSKIKKTDRAAYREGMKQLRQSNDMRQHMRLKRYKHDMKELTSKYLRCKSAEERDSIVSTMFSTRAKMLEDIGRLKQQ